jgi:hypothetical protein
MSACYPHWVTASAFEPHNSPFILPSTLFSEILISSWNKHQIFRTMKNFQTDWRKISKPCLLWWGMRWRSCFRQCATNRKFAGSIPFGFIEIFLWHNPSGPTMAPRSTQPQTEWVPGILTGGWRRPVRRADNLTSFMCQLSEILRASTFWSLKGLYRPEQWLHFSFYFLRKEGFLYSNIHLLYQAARITCVIAIQTKFSIIRLFLRASLVCIYWVCKIYVKSIRSRFADGLNRGFISPYLCPE